VKHALKDLKELVGAAGGFTGSDEDDQTHFPVDGFLWDNSGFLDAGDAQADEYQDAVQ